MKIRYVIFIILIVLIIGIISGLFLSGFGEHLIMGEYDLYNCIYANADRNNFNQNPVMIQKIQDECICFREHNYTDVLGAC